MLLQKYSKEFNINLSNKHMSIVNMQTLKASDLFNNIENINNKDFERTKSISLDFSNIDSIDLKAIKVLLDIQKVALLNNKALSVCNVSPNVKEMLYLTGFNKTFANLATNPISRKSEK